MTSFDTERRELIWPEAQQSQAMSARIADRLSMKIRLLLVRVRISAGLMLGDLIVPGLVGLLLALPTSVLFAATINEETFLDVQNGKLYLQVAGQSDAPVFIFLHGGPGNIVTGLLPFQSNVGRQLEKRFLGVYLHQRGVGKSSPVSNSELTFDDYIDDLDRVVTFVKEKYGRDAVSLVGHSWGGMYAVLYAQAHQEKLVKLVLINTAMNQRALFRDSYDFTVTWARDRKIQAAIEDLQNLDPSFKTLQESAPLQRWAGRAYGGIERRFGIVERQRLTLWSSQYPQWEERRSDIVSAMAPQLLNLDLEDVLLSLRVPALFISSQLDAIVPPRTMQRDYARYGGQKSFLLLEDSHHLPYVDEPDALAKAISQFLAE